MFSQSSCGVQDLDRGNGVGGDGGAQLRGCRSNLRRRGLDWEGSREIVGMRKGQLYGGAVGLRDRWDPGREKGEG